MFYRLIKEPLIHFFLLGAGIFAVYAVVGESDEQRPDEIVVSTGQIERLVTGWRKTRMRLPSKAELEALIDEHVREEVYYREALAMGLDRDDVIIRRRLRQKMEFVTQDLSELIDPTEVELVEYLSRNGDKFRVEPSLGFRQVYFNRDQRSEKVADDAIAILAQLRANPQAEIELLGDSLMLPQHIESLTASGVRNMFGEEFASRVSELAPGSWQGPVPSSYGLHLVIVDKFVGARMPELDEVRDKVEIEWRNEKLAEVNNEIYQGFRDRYSVVVEQPEWLDAGTELGVNGR
jgi:hypothetical protein